MAKDDLISRQAMLDGIDKLIKIHFDRTIVLNKARKVAEDLPSAQPEQRWIPVSEALPEVKQAVLVTTKNGQRDIRKCIDAGHLTWFYHDIIAWIPLPEPYQGGGE